MAGKVPIEVHDYSSDTERTTVLGLLTPVPGLAITEAVRSDDKYGNVVVTHVPTGKSIGWFEGAEPAAGCIVELGGMADWLALQEGENPALGALVWAVVEKWGGVAIKTRSGYARDF